MPNDQAHERPGAVGEAETAAVEHDPVACFGRFGVNDPGPYRCWCLCGVCWSTSLQACVCPDCACDSAGVLA